MVMDINHFMSMVTTVFWSHTEDQFSFSPPQPGPLNSFTSWAPKERKSNQGVGVPMALVFPILLFILPFYFLCCNTWISGSLLTFLAV